MRDTTLLASGERQACRAWIRRHSRSFFLSSLLLPKRVRHGAWALYAFCRRADDAVDAGRSGPEARRQLDGLERRLAAVYRGEAPAHPIDRAFQHLVERYRIPRQLPDRLLYGMEMDLGGAAYETRDELLRYCFAVASTVGLMMTRVMGVDSEVAYLRAADLGIAMQLTNIARDVGEDARRGRVYLPRSLCAEVGLDPRSLPTGSTPMPTPTLRPALELVLGWADEHYRSADRGVPLLPWSCRLAIASSRRIYAAIGDAIRRGGYDSITHRAYVPLPAKLWQVVCALPVLLARSPTPQVAGPADTTLKRLLSEVGLLPPFSEPSLDFVEPGTSGEALP